MKTYLRLLVLLFSSFTGLGLFLLGRTSTSSSSDSISPFNLKHRLERWQEKFNHTIETVDWYAPDTEEKENTPPPGRIPESLQGAFREAQEDWHRRINREHDAFLPPGEQFEDEKALDLGDLDEYGLPDKVVVMGKLHTEDTRWVARELPNWQHAIYTVDVENLTTPLPPNTLTTPINKGREVMPYLTYIIDHYDTLPSVLAFIHPHRDGYPTAWHTDAPLHSNVYSLQHLQLSHVKKAGYANLRCNLNPGCPAEVRPFAPASTKEPEAHMAVAWGELFPEEKDNVPQTIAAACCAQFAVSKEQVRKRPKEEYVHFRKWVTDTNLTDYVSGRVFEYTWHVIFGRDVVDCPSMRECYCNVYGRRCKGSLGNGGGLGAPGGLGRGGRNNDNVGLGVKGVGGPMWKPPARPIPEPTPPDDEMEVPLPPALDFSNAVKETQEVPSWSLAAAADIAKAAVNEYDG